MISKLISMPCRHMRLFCMMLHALLWCIACEGQQWLPANIRNEYPGIAKKIDTAELRDKFWHAVALMNTHPDSSRILLVDVVDKTSRLFQYSSTSSAMLQIGRSYIKEGDYDRGILYYRKALAYAPYYSDKVKLAMLYISVAEPWFLKGMYDSMAFYSYKAAEILPSIPAADRRYADLAVQVYANIGTLWNMIRRPEHALQYYRKAEAIAARKRDTLNLVLVYTGMGGAFLQQRNNDTALYYFRLALKLNTGKVNKLGATIIGQLGFYNMASNQPEKAIPLLKDGIILAEKLGDRNKIVSLALSLGQAYYILEEDDKAMDILLKTFDKYNAVDHPDYSATAAACGSLSDIYALKGDYRQAYKWEEQSVRLSNTLIAKERKRLADELERASQKKQRDKELAETQLQIVIKDSQLKEKNYLILAGIVAVSFLAILAISFYHSNRHKQKLQREQIYTLHREQEIRQLRAMLNGEEKERARIARELHDGVASQLASVRLMLDYLRKKDGKLISPFEVNKAFLQLDEASTELRKATQNLTPDIIIESGMEIALRVFCDKIQQASRKQVDFEVFGDIPRLYPHVELSIYRMVQELVQNVVKHAGATRMLVQIIYREQLLSITVEDNGTGYRASHCSNGTGLKNVQERVRMLNGSIDVSSIKDAGTTVYMEFEIPLLFKHKIDAN